MPVPTGTPLLDDKLALGFTGGPRFNTTVITFGGGREVRNSNWSYAPKFFTFSKNTCLLEEAVAIVEFFTARQGSAEAWGLKDYTTVAQDYVLVRFGQDEIDMEVDGPGGIYARIPNLTAIEVLE